MRTQKKTYAFGYGNITKNTHVNEKEEKNSHVNIEIYEKNSDVNIKDKNAPVNEKNTHVNIKMAVKYS